MNALKALNATLVYGLLTVISPFCAQASGPAGTGGGNWQEADFITTAREIHKALSQQTYMTKETLGIDPDDYMKEIEQVPVQCSFGPFTISMREQNKQAFYFAESKSIFLDCEQYEKLQASGATKKVIVFHEYMRALVQEGSEYRVSSKLPALMREISIAAKSSEIPFTAAHVDACQKNNPGWNPVARVSGDFSYCGYKNDSEKIRQRFNALGITSILKKMTRKQAERIMLSTGEEINWDWNNYTVSVTVRSLFIHNEQLSIEPRIVVKGQGNRDGIYELHLHLRVAEYLSQIRTNMVGATENTYNVDIPNSDTLLVRLNDQFKMEFSRTDLIKNNPDFCGGDDFYVRPTWDTAVRYKKSPDGEPTSEILGYRTKN